MGTCGYGSTFKGNYIEIFYTLRTMLRESEPEDLTAGLDQQFIDELGGRKRMSRVHGHGGLGYKEHREGVLRRLERPLRYMKRKPGFLGTVDQDRPKPIMRLSGFDYVAREVRKG